MSESNRNIYIVDNDPHICKALAWILGDEGYVPTSFKAVSDVLQALENDPPPAAVITDLNFVGEDHAGLGVLTAAMNKNIPRILMTGDSEITEVELIAKGGRAAKQISKPLSIPIILQNLNEALGQGPAIG